MTISQFIKKISMTVAGTAIVALGNTTTAQAISITPTSNGNDLVQEILGNGITIVPNSINYTGAAGAAGIFTDGLSSDIGIDRGIILTTGSALDAEGPNDSPHTTTPNGLPGDSDLDGLIPGSSTQDATVLEFDFHTEGGDVLFNYVFASEEYIEYTNSEFNDVFAFFLNGENLALIPDTSTPVSINTVNGGFPLGSNASNPEYFKNNDLDNGGGDLDIEYDGLTTVLTFEARGLSAGTHRMKLAIADVADDRVDSAVFIEAKSLVTKKVPEPSVLIGLLAVGFAGSLLGKKSIKSDN
ncbi:choice-of-anchor L domain-containing protein [Dapis sp. BLCC M172]|uniref:choice-of-anchor L domain-containing protein n=1 Tax=Dapis sp. BLCC M172 TaxID=2975281 RepID=UPI003CEE4C63